MKRIYTWDAQFSLRNHTAADIRACKGHTVLTQTTANTREEAAAAADAGIDMLICNAANVEIVRTGAPHHFLTAALTIPDWQTDDDVLRGALTALKQGADSIMTARRLEIVEMLAKEDIPVMGHLGLVPRKSTWRGGLRAIGKTADEALALMQDFRDLENAGAFSVEAEVIVADVMAAISKRTSLITVSLGSGPGGDIEGGRTIRIGGAPATTARRRGLSKDRAPRSTTRSTRRCPSTRRRGGGSVRARPFVRRSRLRSIRDS